MAEFELYARWPAKADDDGKTPPEVPFMGVLATNLSVERNDLRRVQDALARRAEDQAVLYRFTNSLYRAASLEDVYEAGLDAVQAGLRCERASILLYGEGEIMRFVAWRGLSDGYRAAVEGHSPWRRDDPDPQPIWVEDIAATDEPDAIKEVVTAEGICGLCFIPLVVDGRLAGKFMAYYPTAHAFTDEETELAVTLSRQLGFALERRQAEAKRERVEARLRRNEERLRAMFEHAGVGMVLVGAERKILAANPAYCRITRRGFADLVGENCANFTHPDDLDEHRRAIERVPVDGGPIACEKRYLAPDGDEVWVRVTLSDVGEGQLLAVVEDIDARRRAEEQKNLLINELNHRVKNTLATVQSLSMQTLRTTEKSADARHLLDSRLSALARAHDVLTRQAWKSAELADVAGQALEPFKTGRCRISLEGPRAHLSPKHALAVSMALHELATNAAKYGALSNDGGRVAVRWNLEPGEVRLTWIESDGPPVTAPQRRGFGSRLIERSLEHDLGAAAAIDFRPEGVVASLGVPLG